MESSAKAEIKKEEQAETTTTGSFSGIGEPSFTMPDGDVQFQTSVESIALTVATLLANYQEARDGRLQVLHKSYSLAMTAEEAELRVPPEAPRSREGTSTPGTQATRVFSECVLSPDTQPHKQPLRRQLGP